MVIVLLASVHLQYNQRHSVIIHCDGRTNVSLFLVILIYLLVCLIYLLILMIYLLVCLIYFIILMIYLLVCLIYLLILMICHLVCLIYFIILMICLLGDSKKHILNVKRNFENIFNRVKDPNHQYEWYVSHSDLSWYVSDCTVIGRYTIFFFCIILSLLLSPRFKLYLVILLLASVYIASTCQVTYHDDDLLFSFELN